LRHTGLVNPQGHDTLYQRVVFPCCQDRRIVNLYGRSIGATLPIDSSPAPRAAWSPGNRFVSSPA
jgi:hypothetical protein